MEIKLFCAITLFVILALVTPTNTIFCTDGNSCFCNYSYAPVCATNGCSYLNTCRLICAEASFSRIGPCPET
ncbi:hypothetical protein B5X24_HaOG216486 [Helicoverpa armigera]|nr:hypothetical protein B5X24_HaOG216486 [Helicoverpa armigera]